MTLESFTVAASMILYFITGTSFALKGDFPWALTWYAYAVANIGLILAAQK
jgi:uncharacterized membrane-anchored protein YitT (DUF2179 family)